MTDEDDDILAGIQGAGEDDDDTILIISTEDEDDETMSTFLDYVLGDSEDEE